MKGKGPKHERETIIIFNEEESTAVFRIAEMIILDRFSAIPAISPCHDFFCDPANRFFNPAKTGLLFSQKD